MTTTTELAMTDSVAEEIQELEDQLEFLESSKKALETLETEWDAMQANTPFSIDLDLSDAESELDRNIEEIETQLEELKSQSE